MAHRQPPAKRGKTLFSFYKKIDGHDDNHSNQDTHSQSNIDVETPIPNLQPTSSSQVVEEREFDVNSIERDPGLRMQIYEHFVNQRDEVRRTYIKAGPYQPKLSEYPKTKVGNQYRRFQYAWFKQFPWLEYSVSKDKAYCFPCFLFGNKNISSGRSSLVTEGFNNWKRVNDGDNCVFLIHVGRSFSSHNSCVKSVQDLMKPSQHIDKVMNAQSREEVLKNRLRLKALIRSVRLLPFQGCAFRGHDESPNSLNRENFIAVVKIQGEVNDNIEKVTLENAPQNAKYTSPKIQKEFLHILANRVRMMIREEVGDACFCILVDEAQDESDKKQMAIVLRFVNCDGFLVERFFEIVSVENTTSATLKKEISDILVCYNLHIQNMRGQGYDGASNMRGEWNGLQTLFLRDCPYAYYVHCFAHRLQLALVATAKEVGFVWQFFSYLTSIINLVGSSPKRISELKSAQRDEIVHMLATGERESGRGANQIGTLHRPGATRWSSHYNSIRSLIDMYSASCIVLEILSKDRQKGNTRGQANGLYTVITTFEFVFILHLMNKIMGITDILCQAVQRKSQDILNALKLVSTMKALLLRLREDDWDTFLEKVDSFCKRHDIDIPDMNDRYKVGHSRQQEDHITIEHHYRFDIFNTVIDFQLMELNSRFNDGAVELLTLSSALDPSDSFKSFNMDDVCTLAKNFYPKDFSEQEIHALRCELEHYKIDVTCDPEFQKISSLSELCRELVITRKSKNYPLIERLIRLVLTLPISTATTKRAFSAMKHVKTTRRNKMEDEFLGDCMTLYIERELAEKIDIDSVVDEFYSLKSRRAQLQ